MNVEKKTVVRKVEDTCVNITLTPDEAWIFRSLLGAMPYSDANRYVRSMLARDASVVFKDKVFREAAMRLKGMTTFTDILRDLYYALDAVALAPVEQEEEKGTNFI